ncbi:TonB-dependent receptor family protein [Mesonia ostreae]|uniref:TonB-dependent receptor n=1 Tax=Mesonia ostreae TaxID=861110 RepID=A0ABU2KKG0_9FLAO|nr:TonB-dependent receptor [Mesonia ostreae]MDT0295218.1 TonB-dependent receptor [Mesonia ostreae]
MKAPFFLYGFVFVVCSNWSIQAQKLQDSTLLDQVILKAPSWQGELTKTPAAVNLLEQPDLNRGTANLLTESFNRIPGVYTQAGALNTNRISIRGIGSRAQYGTNRVKAYFNEIPLSTGDGETVINDIDLDVVDRVEIIKGPNSSLYGSGLGGVIQVMPFAPEEEQSFTKISSVFGSYGLQKQTASLGYSKKNASVFASYNHLKQEGYRENSDYDRQSFHLNSSISISEKSTLSILGNFTCLKAYIPSSISLSAFKENPRQAAFTWKSAKGYESYDRLLLGISYAYQFSEKLGQTTSFFTNYKNAYEPRPFDILKQKIYNLGARTRFTYQNQVFQLPIKASIGAEVLQENYTGSNFENLYEDFPNQGSVRGEIISNLEQDRNYYNVFAQAEIQALSKLKFVGGININTTKYTLSNLFTEEVTTPKSKGNFKTILAPRIAALYEITRQKNLYLNISKGFSIPTVDETLTPQGNINNTLKPEIGWNYELGFKGSWGKNVYTEVALYSIQVKDLLVAERVGKDRYVGKNAGKTNHNGLEFLLKYNWNFNQNLQFQTYASAELNAYSFDDFKDEGEDYSGNELTGVPEHKINFGVDAVLFKHFGLNTNMLWISEIPLNDENSLYSSSYQLLNLKASYNLQLLSNMEMNFSLGVNNLLNETYAISILPNAVGFGGKEPRYFYPGNDRNFYGGLSLNYTL